MSSTSASESASSFPYRRSHPDIDDEVLRPNDKKEREDSGELDDKTDQGPDILVRLDPTSNDHPQNWSTTKKLYHTIAYGQTTFTAQFTASILTPGIPQLSEEFHVGREVAVLCFCIYILGNMVGPVIFAPVSEIYGRKIGVFIPCFISGVFMLVIANVTSIWAVMVFRFIAGVFAAAPIVTSGGAMTDLWKPNQRAAAMVLYALNIIAGSTSSPVLGALLVTTGPYGWRWICWLAGLLQSIIPLINFVTLSETFPPVLEAKEAKRLRLSTGRWELHAKQEEWALDLHEFLQVHFRRPVLMFLTPILFMVITYCSFIFGIMFLVITSVEELFTTTFHFTRVTAYLPLFGVFIGFLTGGGLNVINSFRYAKISHKTGQRPPPEERLPALMLFGWLMPAGCFIYGWTMYPFVHWIAPCIGLVCVGAGIAIGFQTGLVYMADYAGPFAASAIAANTFMRSIYGGVFPLFATQMYHRLGPHWGSSLLGFCTAAAIPLPWVFYFYGARIRAHDPYKMSFDS